MAINDPGAGRRMLAIFVAATVVGWAFNSMSPLGVRSEPATAPVDAVAPSVQLYDNETVKVGLGGLSSAIHPALAVAGGLYENDTAGTSLVINKVNNAAQPPAPDLRTISWLETKKLLAAGRVVLVDARDAAYYETGHIPGAISLPSAGATREEFAAFVAKYPEDTPLVVYCGSAQCPLAARLIGVLTGSMGYTDVRHMAGGYVEYREAENEPAGSGAK